MVGEHLLGGCVCVAYISELGECVPSTARWDRGVGYHCGQGLGLPASFLGIGVVDLLGGCAICISITILGVRVKRLYA